MTGSGKVIFEMWTVPNRNGYYKKKNPSAFLERAIIFEIEKCVYRKLLIS